MARVFSLKSAPLNIWVMMVYIVWVKTWCIRYDKIAKQNVLRVSCGNALLAKYLWKSAVTNCHDSSHFNHMLCTWLHFARSLLVSYSQKLLWSSMLSWVFTLSLPHNPYNEIPHKYRVYKIEQNCNKIWHESKVNTK